MYHHRGGQLVKLVQTGQREAAIGLPFFDDGSVLFGKQFVRKTRRKVDRPDFGLHEAPRKFSSKAPRLMNGTFHEATISPPRVSVSAAFMKNCPESIPPSMSVATTLDGRSGFLIFGVLLSLS